MRILKKIVSIGILALALSGTLIGCSDSEEVKQEEANQREKDQFLINYEENSDKRNKGLQFFKEHDDEYDRLNKKLDEDRAFDNLTTTEQERYIKLVIQMLRLDIVSLSYNDEDKPVTRIEETSDSIKEKIQDEQDKSDDRRASLDPDGEIGKRLKEQKKLEAEETEYLDETKAQKEAVELAEKMFKHLPYSRTGLIDFLKYDGFTYEDAVYGADNINAHWVDNISAYWDEYLKTNDREASDTSKEETENEYSDTSKTETMAQKNVVKAAKNWLDYKPFSREKLIDRLKTDGFIDEDAIYGADNINVDWKQQATQSAKDWLDYKPFSREKLIDRLKTDGFTDEDAIYGVTQAGY